MALLWIGVGFAAFGFLVGTTAGLSSAELTTTLLGLLFALIGGSVGAFLAKLDFEGRRLAGVALLTFSATATLGLYSGIYVRVNDLLRTSDTQQVLATDAGAQKSSASDYLKTADLSLVNFLQREVTRGEKSLLGACELLIEQGGLEKGG